MSRGLSARMPDAPPDAVPASMTWGTLAALADGVCFSWPYRLEPERAADHLEHDLVGAGADPVQAHVAPHPLDPVFLHVAGAPVDLDALVGDLDRDPRRVQLGHADLTDR